MTPLTGRAAAPRERSGVVVTISREYGAGGLAVAGGVAAELGYELLGDDALSEAVARRMGTTALSVADRTTEAPLSERFLGRLGAGMLETLSLATPRLPDDFDEDVRRALERTIVERAAAGRVVILGRNGGIVLGRRPDVLRVFLIADRAWRVARLAAYFEQTPERALADLERIDSGRKKFARDRYDVRWGDPHLYDLVIDVSSVGLATATALIAAAVRAHETV